MFDANSSVLISLSYHYLDFDENTNSINLFRVMSGKPEDLGSLCRLCLHPGCIDIFDKEISSQREKVDLSSKIMACVSVKITPFDPGPQKICGKCMHHIDTWFQFKEECTKVDVLLQTLVAEFTNQSSMVEDGLNLSSEHSLLDISLSSFDLSLEKHLNSPTNLSPFLDCYLNSTPEKTYSLDDSLCPADTNTEYAQQNVKHPHYTASGYLNEINFNHEHADIPLLTTAYTLCPRVSNADNISEQDAIESIGNIENGQICTNKQTKERSEYLNEINFNQHANILLLTTVSNVDNITEQDTIKSVKDVENDETCTNKRKKESSKLHEINYNQDANIPLRTIVSNGCTTVSNANNLSEQDTIESFGNIKNGETFNKQKKESYQCELCGSTFPRFVNLLNHDDTVHETISRQYSCSVCQRLFICENRLKIHVLSHREKLFKCTTCEKSFSSKQSLLVHTRLHSEKYKCDTCGFVSTSKMYLEAHQNKHTGNETVYKCKICSSSFTRRSSLQRHENVHLKHRGKFYKCKICAVFARTYFELKEHMKCHLNCESTFSCQICSKSYKSKKLLLAHSKRHEKAKFICAVCDKQLHSRYELRIHEETHSNSKPFDCFHCDKKFSFKNTLVKHLRQHFSRIRSDVNIYELY